MSSARSSSRHRATALCHRWLTALFDPLNAEPRIEYWAMEYDTQIEFVRAVGALALVPRLGRPHLPADVTVVELDDPSIARWIYLVWRASMSASRRSPFLEQMRAVAEVAAGKCEPERERLSVGESEPQRPWLAT
ncbi:LysR substrate-binding domain-containing protein [Brevibacterium sp. UCMA 11754]|uniref:LysR substrate-binding domain-containing protein n=1 Tax=Brevibacterium sp. UCMA 11754 TaxID=2749198 RepID=UPI002E21BF28